MTMKLTIALKKSSLDHLGNSAVLRATQALPGFAHTWLRAWTNVIIRSTFGIDWYSSFGSGEV